MSNTSTQSASKRPMRRIYFLGSLTIALLVTLALLAPTTQAKTWQPKQPEGPIFTSNPPTADAPMCTYHNPNEWHGLWDPERNCHYDHEHKDNPGVFYAGMPEEERQSAQRLVELFGPPGAWHGGTSLSYPWQTFMGAGDNYNPSPGYEMSENAMKHEGYSWIARANIPNRGGRYISDFRLQIHAIFAAPGAVTRYHSFSLEANVCEIKNGCRIVRTGGWMDFGHLRIRGNVVQLPGQEGDGVRQRLHQTHRYPEMAAEPGFRTAAVWYGQLIRNEFAKTNYSQTDAERPFRKLTMAIETYDAWSNAKHSDPYTNYFFCPAFDCNKNGSTLKMHRLLFELTSEEGFQGYTDRFGRTNTNCTSVGLDCIPGHIDPGKRIGVAYTDKFPPKEYDVSPDGVWWIKYPN